MSWLELVPALLWALAWLVGPGAAALWLMGARGLVMIAAAPPLSVAFIAILAVAYAVAGVPWTPWSVGAAVGVVLLVLLAVRVASRRRWPLRATPDASRSGSSRAVVAAWAVAAVLVSAQLVTSIGAPDAISQTFDNSFHLGAVRFILDTGNASSLAISGFTGGSGVYPAAWHGVTSLVVMSSGSSLPIGANALSFAVSAVVWPGALLLLARVIAPQRTAALWIAAVLGAALPWFPLLPLTFGVLFPFFLATAFLPIGLALVASVLGRGDSLGLPLVTRLVMLGATATAIASAQPAVLFGLVAASLPVAGTVVIQWLRAPRSVLQKSLVSAAAIGLLVIIAAAWRQVGAIGYTAPWGPEAGWLQGAVDVVLFRIDDSMPAVGLAVVVAVGVVRSMLEPGRRWIAGMWLVGALLYYAALVMPGSDLRNVLLGVFYKDPPRLATLYIVLVMPAAVTGALFLWDRLRAWVGKRSVARPARLQVAAAALALVVLAGLQGPAVNSSIVHARWAYEMSEYSPILSVDERALIERLPDTTGLDGSIAGNPWTGSNLAYALVGQTVLNPHFTTPYLAARTTVNTRLNEAASDPEVCDAVRELDVRWALDFGTYFRDAADELSFDSTIGYEGLLDLADAPGFVEVDREGDVVLYRIDACD